METIVKVLLGFTSVAGLGVIGWRLWVLRWEKVVPEAIVTAITKSKPGEDMKAVREVCELILKAQGKWPDVLAHYDI